MTVRTGNVGKNVRRSIAATTFAVATMGVAACSGPSGGAETPASNSGEASQPQQSTSQAAGKPLAGMKPCEALTSEQATKLGLSGPGEKNEFDDVTCDWKAGENLLSVSLNNDMALDEINFSGDKKQETTLAGHDALLVNLGEDTCAFAFAVSDKTSVTLNSTADVSAPPNTACDLVKKAAPMVEKTVSGK